MPYNTDLTRLKDILENPTGVDEELERDLDAAYGEVRDILKAAGFNVPLAAASESIKEAENLIAASKFRSRRHTETSRKEAADFKNEAIGILAKYIEAESEIVFKAV